MCQQALNRQGLMWEIPLDYKIRRRNMLKTLQTPQTLKDRFGLMWSLAGPLLALLRLPVWFLHQDLRYEVIITVQEDRQKQE